MLRRPAGHVAQQRKYWLAFAAIILPWIQVIDAQQQHSKPVREQHHQLRSPSSADPATDKDLAATILATHGEVETPYASRQRKNTASSSSSNRDAVNDEARDKPLRSYESYLYTEDASALDTFALDSSVRAPSPPRHRAGPTTGAGLSSPHIARSLEDWEVEDFVLLATVDGDLYATDRKTGKERWHLEVDQPMVQTEHYRGNTSILNDDYSAVDHYIWVVEPNHDGGLYLWVPQQAGNGLVKMGYTMKQMVEELSPHNDDEQNIVYTGDKKTNMVTLDAATGRVLKWFGSAGSQVNDDSCIKPNTALADMDTEECSSRGIITLGRTEYTVGIQHSDGRAIATLKYSEWGPNTYDADLLQQYHVTLDNRYITSQHDGQVYGFDYARLGERPFFAQKLASPVARVFDVLRPWGAAPGSNPKLAIFPQPPPPSQGDQNDLMRSKSIFINQTEAGSWYAMSGRSYPLILNAPAAQVDSLEWWERQQSWEMMNQKQMNRALIGTHTLERQAPLLTIDAGSKTRGLDVLDDVENGSVQLPTSPYRAPLQAPSLISTAVKISEITTAKVVDLVSNPVMILMFVFFLFYYQQDLRRWYKGKRGDTQFLESPIETMSSGLTPEETIVTRPASPDIRSVDLKGDTLAATTIVEIPPTEATIPALDKEASPSVTFAKLPETGEKNGNNSGDGLDGTPPLEQGKKKKAHRGSRGGTKHKKRNKDKRETSQSRDDDMAPATVDEVIKKAKNLGEEPKLEPDIQTLTNDVEEVSGPVLKMGSLEVNTDQQLGTGSNGTVVFAGKWDGRDVAIKRMLIQFNEIASQETKLLRESDDHPNGKS